MPLFTTPAAVYADARRYCGDRSVAGGQRFTDADLYRFLNTAWGELAEAVTNNDLPIGLFPVYLLQPAYSSYLLRNVQDFGTVESLAEASFDPANKVTITAAVIDSAAESCLVTAAAGHPFQTGNLVYHFGIAGPEPTLNDAWMVERVSGTQYRIRGVVASGALTGTGTAVYLTGGFQPLDFREFEPSANAVPGTMNELCFHSRGQVRLRGASQEVLMRADIRFSGSLPAAPVTLPLEGAHDFLAYRTASLAVLHDRPEMSQRLALVALGSGDNGGIADPVKLRGMLSFLVPAHNQMQRIPVRRPAGFGMRRRLAW